MQEKRAVWLLLGVCLAALLVPLLRLDSYVTSDLWERQRVAEQILDTGFLPEKNTAYAPESPYVYPPAFDLWLAAGKSLGVDYLLALKVLAVALGLLLAYFAYQLSRHFFRHEIALLSAFFIFFMPRVFRLTMQPLPETVGLLLFVVTLHFACKNKMKWAGLFAAMLLFFHVRSFFNVLLVAAILFYSVQGWNGLKRLKWLVLVPLLATPLYWWQRLQGLETGNVGGNAFVAEWSLLQLFGPAILLAAFYVLFWFKYKRYMPLLNWVAVYVAVYLGSLLAGQKATAFRELTYLFVPVGLLAGALVWRLRALNRWIIPFTLLFSLGYCLYVNFNVASPVEKEAIQALAIAAKGPGNVVLSDFVTSYAVPLVTGKKVVIGAFLEGVSHARERLADGQLFLATPQVGQAQAIMKKYGAKMTVLGKTATRQWLPFPVEFRKFESEGFSKTYDNGSTQAYLLT